MIKRQFYSLEHRSRDNKASSASSSSSSESEADSAYASQSANDEEASSPGFSGQPPHIPDDDAVAAENNDSDIASTEWRLDGADSYNEDSLKRHCKEKLTSSKASLSNQWADLVAETLNDKADDFSEECIIACKNVLKCRLCPKTICLTSETMRAHLISKKHARSLKHMKEGKLKVMLNSDGEEEEQGETHAERHARTVASVEQEKVLGNSKRKRASGRQRQSKRAKRKALMARKEEQSLPASVGHGEVASKSLAQKSSGFKASRQKAKTERAKLAN